MTHHEHPVCGRCGAYRHLHPTHFCQRDRRSFWLDEHMPVHHLRGWLWTKVSAKWRWRIVNAMAKVAPGRWHWCDLVDAVYAADVDFYLNDYRDDWCDMPTPFDAGRAVDRPCYCNNLPFEAVA